MRLLLMISTVATCLATGAVSASDVRVNFQPDRLSVSEEGMFLLTAEYGPVVLDNVHFDESGLYTMCSVIVDCANSELVEFSENATFDSSEGGAVGCLSAAQMVYEMFKDADFLEQLLLVSTEFDVRPGADGKSVEGSMTIKPDSPKSDNGNPAKNDGFEPYVTGKVGGGTNEVWGAIEVGVRG